MAKVWGGTLAVTGFIACPCHLPATLPLLIGILGGTSIGGFLSANTGLVYGLATGYFILGLGAGLFLLNRKRVGRRETCNLAEPRKAESSKDYHATDNLETLDITVLRHSMHRGGCKGNQE